MTQEKAQILAEAWFKTLPAENDMPLFNTEEDCVTPILDNNKCLQRSTNLTAELKRIRETVVRSHELQCAPLPEGILYFIYRRGDDGVVDPLYVGIAECVGKRGRLSALFKPGWMRFDHRPNSKGHIGNLNEAASNAAHAYSSWLQSMFLPAAENGVLILRSPIFVKIVLWDGDSPSVLCELDHTPLFVEEKLRLWILCASGHGGRLLNRDGNRILR